MKTAAAQSSFIAARRPASFASELVVMAMLFFGQMMMAADFATITLRPLKTLQIDYPRVVDHIPFIVPASCAILWLVSRRRWPRSSPFVSLILCGILITQIPKYAERRLARVPVIRWVETAELDSIRVHTKFLITEQGSHDGIFVLAALENEQAVRVELDRMGLLRVE